MSNWKVLVFVWLVTISLGALRLSGQKGEFFQAVAHIWVAWLFASAYYLWSMEYLALGVCITIIEVGAFFGLRIYG